LVSFAHRRSALPASFVVAARRRQSNIEQHRRHRQRCAVRAVSALRRDGSARASMPTVSAAPPGEARVRCACERSVHEIAGWNALRISRGSTCERGSGRRREVGSRGHCSHDRQRGGAARRARRCEMCCSAQRRRMRPPMVPCNVAQCDMAQCACSVHMHWSCRDSSTRGAQPTTGRDRRCRATLRTRRDCSIAYSILHVCSAALLTAALQYHQRYITRRTRGRASSVGERPLASNHNKTNASLPTITYNVKKQHHCIYIICI
jgi:hypothetical protein